MKVLKLKKMPKGRYKITTNEGDFILYEEVIVNHLILVGKQIDDKLKEDIMLDNYKVSPYYQALQYLSTRMRSREELKTYLIKKNNEEKIVEDTIIRLTKEGYINDINFAKAYVNDHFNMSNDGTNKIRRGLTNFKINNDIIEEALLNISEDEINNKIDKLIEKQKKVNTKYSGSILKKRILNYLINLGYDADVILDRLNNFAFKDQGNIQKEYQSLYKKYAKKYSDYKLDMIIKQHLFQKGYDTSDIESIIKKEN